MRIREATQEDKVRWDTFVDTEGGVFHQYFDWKYFFEARGYQFIPLIIENDEFQLIGILPIVKKKGRLFSTLNSDVRPGGLLLKRCLSAKEKSEAISIILDHVDSKYSSKCSRFLITENLGSIKEVKEEPTAAFINSGYRFRYDSTTKLPCMFMLELKHPFEDEIWKGLWSHDLRNHIRKAEKAGVIVIHDRAFDYAEEFIKMLSKNYKRHGTTPLTKNQIMMVLDRFKDKARLYVALLNSQPIYAMLFFYYSSKCFLWEVGSYKKDTNHANLLMFKEVFRDTCNAGYKYVEFGWTGTPGLASFKRQFKGIRVPFRTYEKRYSIFRLIAEFGTTVVGRTWSNNKAYLWKQRHRLWYRLTHW